MIEVRLEVRREGGWCVSVWDENALCFTKSRAVVAKVLRDLADEIDAAPTVEVTP